MTQHDVDHQSTLTHGSTGQDPVRVRALDEAGAKGQALTPQEVQEICEALQSQKPKFRNNFHSGISN